MREQLKARPEAPPGKANKGHVYPVGRGSAHDTGNNQFSTPSQSVFQTAICIRKSRLYYSAASHPT